VLEDLYMDFHLGLCYRASTAVEWSMN